MNAKNFKMKMNLCTHETPAFKNIIAHQMILSENFIVNKKLFPPKWDQNFIYYSHQAYFGGQGRLISPNVAQFRPISPMCTQFFELCLTVYSLNVA
jgi:hypothetical protein